MESKMNLPIPNGYRLYGGADISAYSDADGAIFYSCSARFPDGNTFGQIVVRVKNGVAEIIPLPEFVSGRGALSWNPAGLFLATWHDGVAVKYFQINQFKQFTNGFPVVVTQVNTAVSSVDTQARTDAMGAMNLAKTARDDAYKAKLVADSKYNKDQVWALINDRLYGLFTAIRTNNRSDALDTMITDTLFAKVGDWIYLKVKEFGLIK